MRAVDVLIPTRDRPAALAVTLTGLLGQRFTDFNAVVLDPSDGSPGYDAGEARAAIRLLRARGHAVQLARNLPRRGLAHQRQCLLERAGSPRVLFLDDDVILEPEALQRMMEALDAAACGFVGSAVIGLSFADDVRPHQQAVEFWPGDRVKPEHVMPCSPAWRRHLLHNAANLWHVQRDIPLPPRGWRLYKIAWIGGCVLFDRAKLLDCGGFSFWCDVPEEHCGEDVLAQLRVMARHGGCGILPSCAYHQEVPTTVPNREVDLPRWPMAGPAAMADGAMPP
ncbi:Glycosyltransferases involved in cell wall biogenesis [Cupriavidus gilardii J11]|uniref:Glycosyltransferases involved in cell wall biogenesis n=1 Tax=Cupriavidus gilardii J11 TaxID=936133 RepID=A0A562BLE3_9BURK|nr:glycosyltransferase family A protein [Cupriavidus gilardii]TWG85986.1 Glycosyltransferases involved in cell wall biogenesis [Cupriavidus gilardii J11]